ncbi:MAG: hypothetical protein R6V83_10225 [Candidatus Thorarchaeota archaeon]
MGILDWLKRKLKRTEKKPEKGEIRKKSKTAKPEKVESKKTATDFPSSTEGVSVERREQVGSLVVEYERLVERRQQLQAERGELTEKLERGELSSTEFRKALMSKIQEASTVSDKIKKTSSKLTELGYRGVLR